MKRRQQVHVKVDNPRRRSRLDAITDAIVQQYAHESTSEIVRRRQVFLCEAAAVEEEIVELTAKLQNSRNHRAVVAATLSGLTAIVNKRC
jgi:hypothetical protein